MMGALRSRAEPRKERLHLRIETSRASTREFWVFDSNGRGKSPKHLLSLLVAGVLSDVKLLLTVFLGHLDSGSPVLAKAQMRHFDVVTI